MPKSCRDVLDAWAISPLNKEAADFSELSAVRFKLAKPENVRLKRVSCSFERFSGTIFLSILRLNNPVFRDRNENAPHQN
jgi:hypothetical protein